MRNPFNRVFSLVIFTQICDILILNIMYLLLYVLNVYYIQDFFIDIYGDTYWLIGNITYLVSVNSIYMALHSRMLRPEAIIAKAGKTMLLQFVLFLATLAFLHIVTPSRLILSVFYIVTTVVVAFERLLVRKLIKTVRYYGGDECNALLIGNGAALQDMIDLMNDRWNGYNLVGIFTDEDEERYKKVYYMGTIDDAIPYLESTDEIDEIYCSSIDGKQKVIDDIVNYCDDRVIRFYNVPRMNRYQSRWMKMKEMGDLSVLSLRNEPLNVFYNRFIKRSFDLIMSTLFLCTLYPIIYVIVAIVTKITSPGPVYFKQMRTGVDGKDFWCYKFRSMQVNKDSDTLQATKNDVRVTKFGKFLRHSNIDELPQLINVWLGNMSIVGPRPHMLKHTEYYGQMVNKYMVRHFVKPGITGWAQVNGYRGETKELADMEKRIECDIWYLENWNFWLDLVIILKTVQNMIRGEKKAY
jgi:Undecaprenyl-phosphate glucose phosphotransferase